MFILCWKLLLYGCRNIITYKMLIFAKKLIFYKFLISRIRFFFLFFLWKNSTINYYLIPRPFYAPVGPRNYFPLPFSNYFPVVLKFLHVSFVRVLAYSPISFDTGKKKRVSQFAVCPQYSAVITRSFPALLLCRSELPKLASAIFADVFRRFV